MLAAHLALVQFLLFYHATECLDIVLDFPAKLIYTKEHSIFFTVFNANIDERLTVSIDVRNQANNRQVFNKQTTFMTSSPVDTYSLSIRASPLSHEWTFPGPTDDIMCLVNVAVSVSSTSGPNWSRDKVVPVVKRKGHIFIQTDRPVYRPGDEVHVRFIPVDESLHPLNFPISMSIMAPNPNIRATPLLSWSKKATAHDKVIVNTFRLPDTPPLGKWTVNANFYSDNIVHDQFTAVFYVQEFALPTFDLLIHPSRDSFILPDDDEFSVDILANFVYGEPVEGTAHIRFGLFIPGQEDRMHTTHIVPMSEIRRGRLGLTVAVANLTGSATVWSLIDAGAHLFIEVSVTDAAGGKTRSLRNGDVRFTSIPLALDLSRTPKYFKPGLPYTVQAKATYVNGSAAPSLDLEITVTGVRADGRTVNVFTNIIPTCEVGKATARFLAPSNINSMRVSVSTFHLSSHGTRFPTQVEKEAHPQVSSYNKFLQIVLPKGDFMVGVTAAVEIYFTRSATNKTIVYMITSGPNYLSEGKVEASSNSDQIIVTFPVVAQMSPISHITAYYVTHSTSGLPFIVADSAVLRVEEACQGVEPNTNVLAAYDGPPLPGQSLDLEVFGEPLSYVGLSGVDVAALSMRNEMSDEATRSSMNTRSNAFNVLRSFSPGCKVPSRPYSESAFPAIGRALVTSVSHNFLEASNARCDDSEAPPSGLARSKRTVSASTLGFVDKADRFEGMAYECCAVGADDVRSVMNYDGDVCEQRAATVSLGNACREAFLECCREAECIRNHPEWKTRPCLFNPETRSVYVGGGSFSFSTFNIVERATHLLRKNFAHTWFNMDFQLGQTGHIVLSNNSNPRLEKLPDSITSWSIETFTLSTDRGMCVAEPILFSVEHSLFIDVILPHGPVVRGSKVPIEVTVYSYVSRSFQVSVILEAEQNLCSPSLPGQDSDPVIRNLRASENGVASTELIRFIVVPTQAGSYNIKVRMNTPEAHFTDKVVKTLRVIPEGEPQRRTEWILIDNRGDASRSLQPLSLSFPPNTLPETEQATATLHSLESAFLREPLSSNEGGSSDTIAQYLYQLQTIVIKLELSTDSQRAALNADLTRKAQTAYNGLLAYARDMRSVPSSGQAAVSYRQPLYGFSYSPAEVSKPDLWLTSATLRTICRVSELVEIEPDQNIITGSLRWILSHQKSGQRGYFASKPESLNSRKKRSFCSENRPRNAKNKCSKRRHRYGSFRKFKKWQKKCKRRQRQCRRRRNVDAALQKLPYFKNNLDRKIYRTAVVSSFLSFVLKSTNPRNRAFRRPNAFDAVNTLDLRSSLRKAVRYIGSQTIRTINTASPITLTAAGRAIYFLLGKISHKIEEAIEQHKVENGRQWRMEDESMERQNLTPTQRMQMDSATVEATAYAMQIRLLKQISTDERVPGEKFANWLLENRNTNGRWISLRDTLAAVEALESYVKQNRDRSDASSLNVQISAPGMQMPQSMNALGLLSTTNNRSNSFSLPVTNNAVSLSTSGSGMAWLQLDVRYNMPAQPSVTTSSSSSNISTTQSHLCPYDVTISMNRAVTHLMITLRRAASTQSLWQIDLSVRYKPTYDATESNDPTYIVDFGLNSDYEPDPQDLDKLSNSIEKAVDHYRISKRALLLYMSGEKNISFKLREVSNTGNVSPLPVTIYQAAFPERRCVTFYTKAGLPNGIVPFCSSNNASQRSRSDVCYCVNSKTCPRFISRSKSQKILTEDRVRLACRLSTKYAYRVRIESVDENREDWFVYRARIRVIYKQTTELSSIARDQIHTFWLKKTCPNIKIRRRKDYFITGKVAVEGSDGVFKYLLDAKARIEQWPGRLNDCISLSNGQIRTVCSKLNDFDYIFRRDGCS